MIPRATSTFQNREILQLLGGLLGARIGFKETRERNLLELERELADFFKVKWIFTFNSGRTSLSVALRALDLSPGDEIIVPAYTCGIVFEAVLRAGLRPVFVDICPETFNIDPALVPRFITPKTRGIITVHLFGRACRMDEIMEVANRQNLYVIEDVAQALGSKHKGIRIGSFGDMSVLSFGPGNKSLPAGGGGAIVAKNRALVKNLSKLQQMLPDTGLIGDFSVLQKTLAMCTISNSLLYSFLSGIVEEKMEKEDRRILANCLRLLKGKGHIYQTMRSGKLPGLAAKMARLQLSRIDQLNRKRIANAVRLTQLLEQRPTEASRLPSMPEGDDNTFTRYPVLIKKGNVPMIVAKLRKQGIDADRVYYRFKPILDASNARYIQAEKLCKGLICLPNYPTLSEKNLLEISTAFLNAVQLDP